MKKSVLLTIAIILLISIFIAGCAQQNYNPTASRGTNATASTTPGINSNDGNQSPAATITSSPGTAVSPKNNYSGSGNLGGASDIG